MKKPVLKVVIYLLTKFREQEYRTCGTDDYVRNWSLVEASVGLSGSYILADLWSTHSLSCFYEKIEKGFSFLLKSETSRTGIVQYSKICDQDNSTEVKGYLDLGVTRDSVICKRLLEKSSDHFLENYNYYLKGQCYLVYLHPSRPEVEKGKYKENCLFGPASLNSYLQDLVQEFKDFQLKITYYSPDFPASVLTEDNRNLVDFRPV